MNTTSSKLYPILAAAAVALAVSAAATAAEEEAAAPVPPDMAEEASSQQERPAEDAESGSDEAAAPTAPTVHTRMEHGQTITEYRRQGRVFMMTVKPRRGPKQYWNDPDGDGQFQRRTSPDLDENVNLPKWRLGGW